MRNFLLHLIRGGVCLLAPLFLFLSCSSDGGGNSGSQTTEVEESKSTSYKLSFVTSSGDVSLSLSDSTLVATVPDSTATYSYNWYVDLVKQPSTENSFDVSSLTTAGIYAILIAVTDSTTEIVYTAQYNLTVEEGD